MVMAVFAPDSSESLEMYEDCTSSVIKVLREDAEVVPKTSFLQVISMWSWG